MEDELRCAPKDSQPVQGEADACDCCEWIDRVIAGKEVSALGKSFQLVRNVIDLRADRSRLRAENEQLQAKLADSISISDHAPELTKEVNEAVRETCADLIAERDAARESESRLRSVVEIFAATSWTADIYLGKQSFQEIALAALAPSAKPEKP